MFLNELYSFHDVASFAFHTSDRHRAGDRKPWRGTSYDWDKKFAEVVRQAQDEGYTEPDPRLDLSGTDVMRKIMILGKGGR